MFLKTLLIFSFLFLACEQRKEIEKPEPLYACGFRQAYNPDLDWAVDDLKRCVYCAKGERSSIRCIDLFIKRMRAYDKTEPMLDKYFLEEEGWSDPKEETND